MKRKMRCPKSLIPCLLAAALVFAVSGSAAAEDTDVYSGYWKNNAMITIDASGSMAWPVYNHDLDYGAYLQWAIANGFAVDDHGLDANGVGIVWQKHKIYLVSAYMGYAEILGEDGTTKYPATGDPLYPGSDRRELWVSGGIIDTGWEITDWDSMANTIETVTVEGKRYVVYPTKYDESKPGNPVDLRWGETVAYAHAQIAGNRLKNGRDVLLSDVRTDTRTHVAKDYGFLGYLRGAGIYFSGLFETGTWYTLNDSASAAIESGGRKRIYAFVTGNFLNFIKVIEDMQGVGACGAEGWKYLCYQASSEDWISAGADFYSHDTPMTCDQDTATCGVGTYDYPDEPLGDFERSTINPPGDVDYIKVKFEYIDTDSCGDKTANDYVEFFDAAGKSILAIKGQQIHAGSAGTGAAVSYDGGKTWTSKNPLDAQGYTEALQTDYIKVVWHNGSAQNCSGYDRGFHITGYRYTLKRTEATDFSCCNGSDGIGQKIRSRMEVAKEAMKIVLDETADKVNWGLVRWSGTAISLKGQIPSDIQALKSTIDTLTPGGGTPMGEAMQMSYDWIYANVAAKSHQWDCFENFMILVTDGYPSGDLVWDTIHNNSNPDPVFTDANYQDGDYWAGDPNQGQGDVPNYSDDVARWMARGKCATASDETGTNPDINVITHTIGFGLDSPLLADVAEEGCGINITAYNRSELINAFYTLGLLIAKSVAFTAPVVSVDEANRTQSGDELYMAFFKPENGGYWKGNLKKYGLQYLTRSDCGRTEAEWTVVDRYGVIASNCDGSFKTTGVSYWTTTPDGGFVTKGGAGERLKDAIDAVDLSAGPYYDFRQIYTYAAGAMERVLPTNTNLTNAEFNVTDDLDRYKIINYLYGYTYNAYADSRPVARRSWILGDFVHSEPTIVDYLDAQGQLVYRFVILGANDGLLHVFLDYPATLVLGTKTYTSGDEIWAFAPPDLLLRLKEFEFSTQHVYMVDGSPSLYKDPDPAHKVNNYYKKTLVFGERRGGRSYWALDVTQPDPSLWTVKWHIQGGAGGVTSAVTNRIAELGQTWSKPQFAKIQTGSGTYKTLAVFAGGYDPMEDGFPESFEDLDQDGFHDSGEAYTQSPGGVANKYDLYNPGKDSMGRGIWAVDITDGSLQFSALYGDADDDGDETEDVKTGFSQVYCKMIYCFPADLSVVSLSAKRLLIYAADIYGQIWKVTYDYAADSKAYGDPASTKWKVRRIFTANAGSDMPTGNRDAFLSGPSLDGSDTGRKMFYGPDLSLYGNEWTYKTVLYFGTGDREHPIYTMISNRIYVVADYDGTPDVTDETDLLNLTCNELDSHADADGDGTLEIASETDDDIALRNDLKDILKNQYPSQSRECRGWYRVLDKQGDCISGMESHVGEKALSQQTLYYKNVYFTTYQPVFDNPCYNNGRARIYALDYSWGTSTFNYFEGNDTSEEVRDIRDTYQSISNSSIPSGVRVVTRGGHTAGLISAGGAVAGAGEGLGTTLPGPPSGVIPMRWHTQ
jgi:type IV pilus assembly protein PilY1